MLAQLLDTMKPERLQHDMRTYKQVCKLEKKLARIQTELQHHPEKVRDLQAVIEKAEAELRKYGGN